MIDESVKGPSIRDEWRQIDDRPIQALSEIITLDELRQHEAMMQEGGRSQVSLPRLDMRSRRKAEQSEKSRSPAMFAAKQQLMHEKPAVLEKMVKAMNQADVSKQNRNYRLNSLGVFESDVNEVRARSMQRVDLHKGLSTTSMRLSNYPTKDVKLAIPDESVAARLEKMYGRVLRSIDDPSSPHSRTRNQNVTINVNTANARQEIQSTPSKSSSRSLSWTVNLNQSVKRSQMNSGQRSPQGFTSINENSTNAGPPGFSFPDRSMKGQISRQASRFDSFREPSSRQSTTGIVDTRHLDWSKLSLPPEVALAQAQHIASLTEKHQEMYHQAVLEAQSNLVAKMGLESVTMDMDAEELEAYLYHRALAMGLFDSRFDPSNPNTKDVSRKIMAPGSVAEMLEAAVKHTEMMESELQEIRVDLADSSWASSAKLRDFSRRIAKCEKGEWEFSEDGHGAEPGSGLLDSGSLRLPNAVSNEFAKNGPEEDSEQDEPPVQEPSAEGLLISRPTRQMSIVTETRIADYKKRAAVAMAKASTPGCLKVKPLPDLPEAPSASLHLQARLERLWTLLSVPLPQRLDMVLNYSKKERAMQFEDALDLWEEAAAVLSYREDCIRSFQLMKHNLGGGFIAHLSVAEFERLAINLLQATVQMRALKDKLMDMYGSEFKVGGRPYPGDDSTEEDLLVFLEGLATYKGSVSIFA